jgi:hypothetical protein
MNGTVSRRVFVGRTALGLGVAAVGGGAVALSFADLGGQSVNSLGAVGEEIDRQLAEGIAKMKDGLGAGARQVATIMRLYASTVDDDQLRGALRKANRRTVTTAAQPNHGELVRRARKLGINPAIVPPHSLNQVGNEAAFDRLSREGLAPSMREVADLVDNVAAKLDDLAKRAGGPQLLAVALRQPIPEPVDCGNCNDIKAGMDNAALLMDVACGLAVLFPVPPAVAACQAAIASFLVMVGAYGSCQAIVQLCEYYYNN